MKTQRNESTDGGFTKLYPTLSERPFINTTQQHSIHTFLLILFLLLLGPAQAAKYYVSPGGNDANTGTINSPFKTINKAWTLVNAGDTIYLRGGTYVYTSPQILMNKSGTATNNIKIWAYPNELPVITKGSPYNYSGMGSGVGSAGIYLRNSSYIQLKGLEVFGFSQENSEIWRGILAYDVNNSTFENLNVHHNGLGMGFAHNSAGNTVTNSDFHHNYDPLSPTAYGNSDGLQFAYIDGAAVNGTNTVTGCRAWSNADDGFDAFTNDSYMVYLNCWAFWNGYREDGVTEGGNGDGFKFGTTSVTTVTKRVVKNCLSFQNRMRGFDQNTAQCVVEMYNNTSYANVTARGYDFWYGTTANKFQNNISFSDGNIPIFTAQSYVDHNTYLLSGASNPAVTVTSADFVSTNSAGVDGARQSDGSLPALSFLHLSSGSDLINAGVNVGLPFTGSAPDLGAYEVNGSSITTGTITGSPFCAGSPVTVPYTIAGTFNSGNIFTAQLSDATGNFASPVNIGTLSGTGSGTINATLPSVTASGTGYRIRVVASNPSTTGATNTSNLVINSVGSASVSISTPSTTVCSSATVVFTATALNGGTSPSYQWKLNGTNVGTNSSTYSNSALVNNSVITCVMTSSSACASGSPATSNPVTMTVTPSQLAAVSISASSTSICSGTSVTFTAAATAGGSSPSYQWKVNGTNVGTNSSTFSSSSLSNNSIVTCVMTSNAVCVTGNPATSNALTISVSTAQTAGVTITASSATICAGTSVTFTATPVNGGTSPSYQWKLNGINIGTNSPSFTSGTLANSNVVSCVMTSNAACISGNPAASNSITIAVNPILPVSATITASANSICSGTSVTFLAYPVNGGSAPVYQWKKNGATVGINSYSYADNALNNNDVISCVVTSNVACPSGNPATSNTISMSVSSCGNSAPIVSNQTFSIDENSPDGSCVGQMVAMDPNSGQTLTYSIVSGNTGNAFSIGASSGLIYVNNRSALNFETNPVFSIIVSVSDNGSSPLTTQAMATILLRDVNEPPIVANQTFSLPENSLNGTYVGMTNAYDVDAGQTLTYSIICGNTNGAFSINPLSGQIDVANSGELNYELRNSYVLQVLVQDNGAGPLSTAATITINLIDVNEPPVVFDNTFSVVELASHGTVVGTVEATDPDAGQTLTYSITSGNLSNAFAIDPLSGVITVDNSKAIRYRKTPVFYLTVNVTDNGAGMLSSSAVMTINVLNSALGTTMGITSLAIDTAYVGVNYDFTVTSTIDNGTAEISTTGLPEGLTLSDNGDGSFKISGVPQESGIGVNHLELLVSADERTVLQDFQLVILPMGTRGGSDILTNILNIYPNPVVGGTLYVQVSDQLDEPFDLVVLDLQGKSLYKRHFESGGVDFSLDVSSYPVGMYITRLVSTDFKQSEKFIRK